MKKIITLSLLAASGFAFANMQSNTPTDPQTGVPTEQVFGQFDGKGKHEKHGKHPKGERGGFVDESLAVKSLAEAQNAADNTPFTIEGAIIKQVGKDEFIFKDVNGTEHEIEVSKRAWHGQTVQPSDKIKIQGKVDKEWNKTELEVKNITKL